MSNRHYHKTLRLHKQDADRLAWLAKDIGYRDIKEYVQIALTAYEALLSRERHDQSLWFGCSPETSIPLKLPQVYDLYQHIDCVDDVFIEVENTYDFTGAHIWAAVWLLYDILESMLAGKFIYAATSDAVNSREVILDYLRPN